MPKIKALTRGGIAKRVERDLGLSHAAAYGLVERILFHICRSLSQGEEVKITGVGTFLLRDKRERLGRNPRTGEPYPVSARRVLSFRPSQMMAVQINENESSGRSEE